jgi:hypothetical protein
MQAWNAFAHNNRYKRRWRHRIRARLRRGFRLVSERHKGKKKKKKKKKEEEEHAIGDGAHLHDQCQRIAFSRHITLWTFGRPLLQQQPSEI